MVDSRQCVGAGGSDRQVKMTIKPNDQVSVKIPMRGRDPMVKLAPVVSITGDTARVYFRDNRTSRDVPIQQLQPVSSRFGGRAAVEISPIARGINESFLRR